MNPHVNALAGRLSLRPPQRRSLEILDRLAEIVPPRKDCDIAAALDVIRSEFPGVTDFERDFVSVCFALATGVGKTRLMGAFIGYLHLAHGIRNFFVLAPNLTIYDKLITDFTPNTPKYVFKGIAEFAATPPAIITGDNYESQAGALLEGLAPCHVNIFNISKINSEVRGGKEPRIKRLRELIGQSYFAYLAGLPDLVLLMDESHRYRASAGVRAINELRPVLGLELTATPQVETGRGPVRFKNVIYDYPLAQALADGFVKEPAVVTRRDFDPAGMPPEALEQLKLEDGIRLHEGVKVELETYAREAGRPIVKPFLLVIARDTTHAAQLLARIESPAFFDGRYRGRAIQVDSSRTGADEEAMIERLLKVEHADEPTEIVIHVNMLKEGWDVTNLYTIVPLRAANARTLIEQSIGRGLRLPYGRRTGVSAVDRLNIVAHDRFQEIIDEANRPDSLIRLHVVELDPGAMGRRTVTVVSQPVLSSKLGIVPEGVTPSTIVAGADVPRAFARPEEEQVAQATLTVLWEQGSRPDETPTLEYATRPEARAAIHARVAEKLRPEQLALAGLAEPADVSRIVDATLDLAVRESISIPRILVVPKGEVRTGYRLFALALDGVRYQPVSNDLLAQHLRTGQVERLHLGGEAADDRRLEDYVVAGLTAFDDVSYDDHAEYLYDLAGQVVRHLRGYLDEAGARNVLQYYQRDIARLVHAQMQEHAVEEAAEYEVRVTRGFTELKATAYTEPEGAAVRDFRQAPDERATIASYRYGGFHRALFPTTRFQSDPERILAIILDREAQKWFRPAKGQVEIFYRLGTGQAEYVPDFVAETEDGKYVLEPKAEGQLDDPEVIAKKEAAVAWCAHATAYEQAHGGKAWQYVLIPHTAIAENMTLGGLVARYVT